MTRSCQKWKFQPNWYWLLDFAKKCLKFLLKNIHALHSAFIGIFGCMKNFAWTENWKGKSCSKLARAKNSFLCFWRIFAQSQHYSYCVISAASWLSMSSERFIFQLCNAIYPEIFVTKSKIFQFKVASCLVSTLSFNIQGKRIIDMKLSIWAKRNVLKHNLSKFFLKWNHLPNFNGLSLGT